MSEGDELSSRRVRDGFPQEDKRSPTVDRKENACLDSDTQSEELREIFYGMILEFREKC